MLAAAAAPAAARLVSRESAILDFNHRVLAQAQRADVPPLERLRYLTIVSSNLDEFFEVRFAELLEASRSTHPTVSSADVAAVSAAARALLDAQYRVFNDEVMPALRQHGVVVLNHTERDEAQRKWVARYFARQVRPLLVPVALDPSHPFPQIANKSLNFICRLGGRDAFGRANLIAIVKVPRVLPRVIRLPDELAGGRQVFVLLTSVIRAHLAELFPGRTVDAFSQFRVTRDSDLDVDEDEVTNLRQALRTGLSTRHYGQAIRLEVMQTCPAQLSQFLLAQFGLGEDMLFRVNGPVNLGPLTALIDQASADELRFAPFEPAWPAQRLPPGVSIFDALRCGDLLLHHPFESFAPVVQFLREAVDDPEVLAIKQTIYRTGAKSVLMELLIEAARRGKEVTCVVELKARFDEEANINWAERLEAVGAQVVYGIVGLKTHAKLLLVTRREGKRLRRYVHLSTGNYNPRTAELYTDIGYLSCDAGLTLDADTLFLQLASQVNLRATRHLLTAPFVLHRRMREHIELVARAARRRAPARIVAKMNSLTDAALIDALVAAAAAGARIDLIVRGACLLPADLPGLGGRIRVRSVVGRFLEHTRVMYFRWGRGGDDEVLFLSSADWMTRNMFGRIEVAWPVHDAALRQRVIDECLVPYLHDTLDAWTRGPDGQYRRDADGGDSGGGGSGGLGHVSAQQALLRRYDPQAR